MSRFDKRYLEVERMPPGTEKAVQLAVYGLLTDGGHHKQHFLEEILKALGEDLDEVREELGDDYEWEPGIPP